MNEVSKFWNELKKEGQNKFFTKPILCRKSDIVYKIQTKDDFIFEDSFWDVFHKYSFHICHINYGCYGSIYEMRFRIEHRKIK